MSSLVRKDGAFSALLIVAGSTTVARPTADSPILWSPLPSQPDQDRGYEQHPLRARTALATAQRMGIVIIGGPDGIGTFSLRWSSAATKPIVTPGVVGM